MAPKATLFRRRREPAVTNSGKLDWKLSRGLTHLPPPLPPIPHPPPSLLFPVHAATLRSPLYFSPLWNVRGDPSSFVPTKGYDFTLLGWNARSDTLTPY